MARGSIPNTQHVTSTSLHRLPLHTSTWTTHTCTTANHTDSNALSTYLALNHAHRHPEPRRAAPPPRNLSAPHPALPNTTQLPITTRIGYSRQLRQQTMLERKKAATDGNLHNTR